MQVKITIGYPEKRTLTISWADWKENRIEGENSIPLYKGSPVWSYEMIEVAKKQEKKQVRKETVDEFMIRVKQENRPCKGKNCNEIGYHVGGYCDTHFVILHRFLKKEGISLKEFEARYRKGAK